jgi:hypothetical protein
MIRDWRATQQNFFKEKVEFKQDQRIIDYFINSTLPTYGHGPISYFLDKINFVENLKNYQQALLIFNEKIEKDELKSFIQQFKNKIVDNSKICISINKFQIYSKNSSLNLNEDMILLYMIL